MSRYIIFTTIIYLCLIFSARSVAQTVSLVTGNGTRGYTGDGAPAAVAECFAPAGIAVDPSGNVYFSDLGNNVIRKVNTSGIISTVAGTGSYGYTGNGGPATAAQINQPTSVAIDGSGNIFFTDDANNVVREVNTAGIISTVAGNATSGFSGDGFPATNAELNRPAGVAVDRDGNIFIADTYNQVIREVVATTGKIITVAGTAGVTGFGANGSNALASGLNYPKGVAVDNYGNFYIVDQGNDVIRKVDIGSGNMNTYAGNDTLGYSGDGGYANSARLNIPTEIAFDGHDNLFIADYSNHVIRRERTDGVIETYAGNGTSGTGGNGGPATAAQFEGPYGVAVDNNGNVYIADEIANEVRELIYSDGIVGPGSATSGKMDIFPNPTKDDFVIRIPTTSSSAEIMVTDMTGKTIKNAVANATGSTDISFRLNNVAPGCYLVKVVVGDQVYHDKVVIVP